MPNNAKRMLRYYVSVVSKKSNVSTSDHNSCESDNRLVYLKCYQLLEL